MPAVPSFVVEYFLLGKIGRDSVERYTQDGGIAIDVWLAFAAQPDDSRRILLAPVQGKSSTGLASALHTRFIEYRTRKGGRSPVRSGVSAMDSYAIASVNFDELAHVLLPMTSWWKQSNVHEVTVKASAASSMLQSAVLARLQSIPGASFAEDFEPEYRTLAKQMYEAAPVLALVGVFILARTQSRLFTGLPASPREPGFSNAFFDWVSVHAQSIALTAYQELLERKASGRPSASTASGPESQEQLVHRVFLDRTIEVSDFDALSTIKADAAARVFDISCRTVTWGIVDVGIDGRHPAFLDHDAKDPTGKPLAHKPSRVRRTFNFSRIELMRSFDLTVGNPASPARDAEIQFVIDALLKVPGRVDTPGFRATAAQNLNLIALQLEHGSTPDWNLIEPLIELVDPEPASLVSDHGTHVAGILGADWRGDTVNPDGRHERKLVGVCPDINLYDLRVIHESRQDSLESALMAALDFVAYLNRRKGVNEALIAGVNISLSIPYDVRTYGCGVTPVCVASDRLGDSGVVVVAAAGNRGWSDQELGFGQFMFCSVTDPGNAHQVITVGATHRLKPHLHGVSFFSSRGPTGDGRVKPDLVAPGEKIRGPVRGESDGLQDGTSMAAPFVSGAAAMLVSRHKELLGDPQRVKEILCSTATDLGRERYFQGHGLVDIFRALQSV